MAYLYRHIRLDKNEVFYIGIGSDNYYKRAYSKNYRNKYWNNIINKTNYDVEIVLDNLNKKNCIEKEIEFIKLYGRIDLKTGTLVNLTDGGEGLNGFNHSDLAKLKISEFQKNKVFSKETKKKISESKIGKKRGDFHTEESKNKISESMKNRIISDETRLKMSLAATKRNLKRSLNN
jgi:hypothetical protein